MGPEAAMNLVDSARGSWHSGGGDDGHGAHGKGAGYGYGDEGDRERGLSREGLRDGHRGERFSKRQLTVG